MAAKKKEIEEIKLPFDQLFQESGDSLPIFVGVIVDMGLLKRYHKDVEAHKKGAVLEPVVSLEAYERAREVFKNEVI
jgi:hypothetical protein